MKQMEKPIRRAVLAIALFLAAGLLTAAQQASAAKPPAGRTYFVVVLGVATDRAEVYELNAGCLTFKRRRVCDEDGDCGRWWLIEEEARGRSQWGFGFESQLIDDETGLTVSVEGTGRIDARGRGSSVAAAAHGIDPDSGVGINFAVAGRSARPARCEQLVADFAAARQ